MQHTHIYAPIRDAVAQRVDRLLSLFAEPFDLLPSMVKQERDAILFEEGKGRLIIAVVSLCRKRNGLAVPEKLYTSCCGNMPIQSALYCQAFSLSLQCMWIQSIVQEGANVREAQRMASEKD